MSSSDNSEESQETVKSDPSRSPSSNKTEQNEENEISSNTTDLNNSEPESSERKSPIDDDNEAGSVAANNKKESQEPVVTENGSVRHVPKYIQDLLNAIISLQSPDDLQVHQFSAQLQTINNEADFKWLCEGISMAGSSDRSVASVVGAVCRDAATHAVGGTKLRSILFRTAQQVFEDHQRLAAVSHEKFVTSTVFLGEVFYYVRSNQGVPFAIVATPLIVMLNKILVKHLNELQEKGYNRTCCRRNELMNCNKAMAELRCHDQPEKKSNGLTECDKKEQSSLLAHNQEEALTKSKMNSNTIHEHLNSDVMVVAKQLLQNGDHLYKLCPEGVSQMVQRLTEVLVRCSLSQTATLQVVAALAEMWPRLSSYVHPRSCHAVLAASMRLSLNL